MAAIVVFDMTIHIDKERQGYATCSQAYEKSASAWVLVSSQVFEFEELDNEALDVDAA